MNNRGALVIRFNGKGFSTVSMCLHPIGEEGLNFPNSRFYLFNYLGAICTVIRYVVNEPHRAGVADVQIL